MKEATGNAVLRAYSLAVKDFEKAVKDFEKDATMTRREISAGFIIPKGQKKGNKKGFQVFVVVNRYDEARQVVDPDSGGLL